MAVTRSRTTFCGIPAVERDAIPADAVAAVLGAGHSFGSPHEGAENGPFFLRTLSKAYTWSASRPLVAAVESGAPALAGVVDIGDLRLEDGLAAAVAEIAEEVERLPSGTAPCVIGGDHTVTAGVLAGLAARDATQFTVVQFDNHPDLQTWGDGPRAPSRELLFNTNVMSHVADAVGAERVVQIGLLPYLTVEEESSDALPGFLGRSGRQFSLLNDAVHDPELLRKTPGLDGPAARDIYVTVDLDVLSDAEMSSTPYPSPLGLTTRELMRLIDVVLRGNRLVGFDVVEFAASRDDRNPKTLADAGRATSIFLHLLTHTAGARSDAVVAR